MKFVETQPGDTVIVQIARSHLPVALTALHRGGFGHLTKVLDPTRSPVGGQLDRLGIEMPIGLAVDERSVAVVVSAPARTAVVVEIFRKSCGCPSWTVTRTVTPIPVLFATFGQKTRVRKSAHFDPPPPG